MHEVMYQEEGMDGWCVCSSVKVSVPSSPTASPSSSSSTAGGLLRTRAVVLVQVLDRWSRNGGRKVSRYIYYGMSVWVVQ